MRFEKGLLACGVVSSLLYVAIDVLAAVRHGDYHSFVTQSISELMARGAPTERLVDPLFLLYDVLVIAFGIGIWRSAARKRPGHLVGGSMIAYGTLGFLGPTLFEMNVRGTGDARTDVPHIVLTGVIVLLILLMLGSGAFLLRRWFRSYSWATIALVLVSGALSGFEARHLAAGEPTPWLGALERINIGAYLVWAAVLAIALLRAQPAEAACVVSTRSSKLKGG